MVSVLWMQTFYLKENDKFMTEEIWIECSCGYQGFADMVKFEGMKYKHPVCPSCGEMISEILEIPHNKWVEKINS